jgi:hypothetical protein
MSRAKKTDGAVAKAQTVVAVKDNGAAARRDVQLAQAEQFISQLRAVEKRGERDALKAAILLGLAINYVRPMLAGRFTEWASDRFPDISAGRQHYYRKIAGDFQLKFSRRLGLPDCRDCSGVTSIITKFTGKRDAELMLDDYIGERSISDIMVDLGVKPQKPRGGFAPAAAETDSFVREIRPDLAGVRPRDLDEAARGQFAEWRATRLSKPADQTRLLYEAAKQAFNHALGKIADLVNGSTPRYRRLSPEECAEIARQLRAFADIVARSATRQRAAERKAKDIT